MDKVYESGKVTKPNKGSLGKELDIRLVEYLSVKNIDLVPNGTVALEVAYRVLDLKG